MGKKLKKKCCKRYLRKAHACKKCPVIAPLAKAEQKKAIRHLRKAASEKHKH